MIYRIFSTLPTFKELTFKPGLNILLAEKSKLAGTKQTRNGAGKSSVLEIVHFVLAGDCPPDSIFRVPELINFSFGMEFDLGGQVVQAERSGLDPNVIKVTAENFDAWPIKPDEVDLFGLKTLSLKSWDRVLGALIFGLEKLLNQTQLTYGPTFRSLFPYFVRRAPGGFTEPHLYFLQSKPYQWQVAISFLLGLDWTIPQEWQLVRDQEDRIKKLRSAVSEGELEEIVGKKAELRAEIATREIEVNRAENRLINFQVLPDFRQYEQRAATLSGDISRLSTENTLDDELLNDLEDAISDERSPEITDLQRVYQEAGVVLSDIALRSFGEVRLFHESVIANRRSYLEIEINSAKRRISEREAKKRKLDDERQQCLGLLRSHGALEQFRKLQAEFGKRSADLAMLRKRFDAAEQIEEGLAKSKIRQQELLLRLQQDYSEQSSSLNRAIVAFQDISAQLYEKPARFTPSETKNGPQFKVEVQGERSPGIGHMQVFCFDMMLTKIVSNRGMGPGFIIHDSHLFDPVDARQVGTALLTGAEIAGQLKSQYIVTLNSDKQIEFPGKASIEGFLVPITLTDASETGGLFGLRFS